MFNAKDQRVKNLWEKGMRDLSAIARKLGYDGSARQKGIERVREALGRLGISIPAKKAGGGEEVNDGEVRNPSA